MTNNPYSISVRDLYAAGRDHIPEELQTDTHLIFNSPAALDFNSPGAQGFGVKRAGLSIPGSIMLLISPGCCGRNTSALRAPGKFGERFAYLLLDENDIVTGRHLAKIPAAIQLFVESRPEPPTAVMLCITCVDALLGTDMERVCRKAQEAVHLPVLPCYMYALTRESHRPPMVAVRETVYSLLRPGKKQANAANLLGFFAPLQEDSEIYPLLHHAGLRNIRELSRCRNMEEYHELSRANFNLVLNPEARGAARWFEQNLGIPSVELTRLYQLDKIHTQYQLLAMTLKTRIVDVSWFTDAQAVANQFCRAHSKEVLAIGSRINANAFELALAMVRYGLSVSEIYATPTPYDYFYLKRLAKLSPGTLVYSNLSPTMLHYTPEGKGITLALGADACYYHPDAAHVLFNEEQQPFGYSGVKKLFFAMQRALEQRVGKEGSP